MTTVMETEASIRFEGIGVGTEIWGGTQANFAIARPGQHAKEAAVLLNAPASAYLAAELGQPDSAELRARAAEVVGRLWLTRLLNAGKHIDSLVVLSREAMASSPDFVAALRADAAAAAESHRDTEHAHA